MGDDEHHEYYTQERQTEQKRLAAMGDKELCEYYVHKQQVEQQHIAAMVDDERREYYAHKRQAEQQRLAAMGDDELRKYYTQQQQAEQQRVAVMEDDKLQKFYTKKRQAELLVTAMGNEKHCVHNSLEWKAKQKCGVVMEDEEHRLEASLYIDSQPCVESAGILHSYNSPNMPSRKRRAKQRPYRLEHHRQHAC